MKTFLTAVALAAFVAFSVVAAPAMAKQPKHQTDLTKLEEGVNKLILKAYNYKMFALTYEEVYNKNPTEYNLMQALKAAAVAKKAYTDAAVANAVLEQLQKSGGEK